MDDGLDLRKAAFECMYTLLEKCLERIDVLEFLDHVEDGLKVSTHIPLFPFPSLLVMSDCATGPLRHQAPHLSHAREDGEPLPCSGHTPLDCCLVRTLVRLEVVQRMGRLVEPIKATVLAKVPLYATTYLPMPMN